MKREGTFRPPTATKKRLFKNVEKGVAASLPPAYSGTKQLVTVQKFRSPGSMAQTNNFYGLVQALL
jgi:hypothetical protein